MNDRHIKQSPMLTLPSLGGGSNSPLVRKPSGSGGDGWPFDLDKLTFTGKSPNYRWRSQTTQDTAGIYLKPDGTHLYVLSNDGKIRDHILSTAFDLWSASYHYVSSTLTGSPRGLFFKSDGTQFYYLDNNVLRAYDLSPAWNLGSMSLSSNAYTISNLTNTNNSSALSFKPDGSKFYVTEHNSGNDNYIHQYSLSSNWDLSSSISYGNASSQLGTGWGTGTLRGISFKSDGTKMWISEGSYNISEFSLSTAWDITTHGTRNFNRTVYNVIEGTQGKGMNLLWKSDGSIYYTPFKAQTLAQFEPSSSWTFGTVSGDTPGDQAKYTKYRLPLSSMSSTYATNWNPDGTIFYHVGGGSGITSRTASTPFDLKTLSSSTTYGYFTGTSYGTYDFKFNTAGTKVLVLNTWGTKKVWEYTLSTAFDISTLSSTGNQLDLTSGGTLSSFCGGCISDDGKYIYANNSSSIKQFTLSTAFDITTASYTQQVCCYPMSGWDGMCKISPDGTQMILQKNGYPNDHQFTSYELTTAWDISTLTFQKTVKMHDKAPHVPSVVHSAGWSIHNGSWYFMGYYRYFGIQVDFV